MPAGAGKGGIQLTLEDIRVSDKAFLLCSEVAPVLGSDPNTIRWQAHHAPEKLGFPVVVLRSRVKIPRIPFINFILDGGKEESNGNHNQQ